MKKEKGKQTMTGDDLEAVERTRHLIYDQLNKRAILWEFSEIQETPDGKYSFSYWEVTPAKKHAQSVAYHLQKAKEALKDLTLCEDLTSEQRQQITALNDEATKAQHTAHDLKKSFEKP